MEADILAQLRLPPDRKIKNLSHGMRLKMALACALPFRPKLLVLDEPFSGLDPLVRDEFMENLLRQAGDGMTILISSHELTELEGVATHVAFLDRGRLLFQEPMSDLTDRLREVHVALDRGARAPAQMPKEWLDFRISGNVASFVDTAYSEDRLAARRHRRFRQRARDRRPAHWIALHLQDPRPGNPRWERGIDDLAHFQERLEAAVAVGGGDGAGARHRRDDLVAL